MTSYLSLSVLKSFFCPVTPQIRDYESSTPSNTTACRLRERRFAVVSRPGAISRRLDVICFYRLSPRMCVRHSKTTWLQRPWCRSQSMTRRVQPSASRSMVMRCCSLTRQRKSTNQRDLRRLRRARKHIAMSL